MFKKVNPNQLLPQMEEEILKFWDENKIFEKTLEKTKKGKPYVFYDGPPFATGTPHYGHIVTSTIKDAIPRYWTMRGRYAQRVWGWDCHGLPIENIAERELGIKSKIEIEKMGVEKFNNYCRDRVLSYVKEWERVIRRLGRWVDMENAYKTMDKNYMESVWWVFQQLWKKGLIYEGFRSIHICPRCETTLSHQEVTEGYKEIVDISVIVKFEMRDKSFGEGKNYILAWTTTPWTLIGNVALAIGENIDYVKVKFGGDYYILAKQRMQEIFKDLEYESVEKIETESLVGKSYIPIFDYYVGKGLKNSANGWKIYAADFVTTDEGTGVVHIAPAFGEDDLNLGKKVGLPFIQHVSMDGCIKPEAKDFAGLSVKPADDHQKTDQLIVRYLSEKKALFKQEKYAHAYPHCWRCDTPLINYATSSWFVNVSKIKEKAVKLAQKINWFPAHIKEGRFGKWLEGARDWSISRQRYWASVIPIWKCSHVLTEKSEDTANDKTCDYIQVIGSIEELEKISGQKIEDLHKHVVDKITFRCKKCRGIMRRVPDVLDTWFDSGSMPYAQLHYPFENKEKFEKGFPAEFIGEGIDQTRAWFYYLHIIASAIKNSRAFNNVVVNGIVTGKGGKKLSKKLKNYTDPEEIFARYGADALRLYLLSSPVVAAENLEVKDKEIAEIVRGTLRMLWNSYSFFVLYANIDKFEAKPKKIKLSNNLLDKWIVSELNVLIKEVNDAMEKYELNTACRLFPRFIDDLSNWYIRRSRRRFWKSTNDEDKTNAYETLHYVLVELSKLMAPFTPFISEEIYRNLQGSFSHKADESKKVVNDQFPLSVHLEDYPQSSPKLINKSLNSQMKTVREIVSTGLQLRAQAGIKVRQPLGNFTIGDYQLPNSLLDIIKDEVNVKELVVNKDCKFPELDTNLNKELVLEGQAREIIRLIQEMRKKAGYEVSDRIKVFLEGLKDACEKHAKMIKREVLASRLESEKIAQPDLESNFEISGQKIIIQIKKEG